MAARRPAKPTTAKDTKEKRARAPARRDTGARSGQEHDIAVAAYYKAQERGFTPGHEVEDWLAAESEVLRRQP